jgi:photosystem II stability/assembly factor-like uncharacterized protein
MKIRRILLIVMWLLPVTVLFGQWQPMGPPGGNFRALATTPSNDNIQYLASSSSPSSIWKTTDAGNNWSRIGTVNDNVYSLAVDPVNANIVYAGGVNYMNRSTNGGTSWTQLTLPTYHWYVYETKIHPTIPTTIMAACYIYANNYYHMGFLKSTNSGTNWTSETLTVDTSYAYSLAIDPTNPNNVYVGGYRYASSVYTPTVFKSTDGGNNFALTGSFSGTPYYVYSVAVHQTNSNYVYAGTLYGVYRSTDGGATWAQASTGNYNYSISTTPVNANLLYSGGYGIIYRSTDAGATWASSSTGLAGYAFNGLAASRTVATRVYAANNTDYYRSTDAGVTWAFAHNGLNAAPVNTMNNAPSAPGTIYLDCNGTKQYRSNNNGATWTPLTLALGCGSLCDFAIAYNNPNYVLEFEGSG